MNARRGRLPARLRLTLWYTLLLAGTQLVLGVTGLWLVQRTLYGNADELLRSKAAAVQTEVDWARGRISFDAPGLPEGQMPAVAAGLDVVRIWDRDGRAVFTREGLPGLAPADPAAVQAILDDRHAFETARGPDGTAVRLYLEPVRAGERIVGVAQAGRSLREVEAIVDQLRLIGAFGLAAALALAWAGGYFLAGRALAPVDRITRAAERIGAEDLSRRLALALPDDELGRLARAFDGMIGRLDEAFQRQRRFTADAAHELRTPLAIICAQAEAARGRPREPTYDARVLDGIYQEGQRLRQPVESLLVLARIDAGQPLVLVPLDLEDLVADVTERVAPRAHERGLEIRTLIGETAPVPGDATWLTQLLLNLLDNALRHTPPGGRVTLSLEPAPGGVLLKVADTGEGIAAEHLPRIFERFYRADRARTRTTGGVGLGLAICGWVVRAHHGRLTAESEVSRGTVFSVWLPAVRPATGPAQARPGATLEARSLSPAAPDRHRG